MKALGMKLKLVAGGNADVTEICHLAFWVVVIVQSSPNVVNMY